MSRFLFLLLTCGALVAADWQDLPGGRILSLDVAPGGKSGFTSVAGEADIAFTNINVVSESDVAGLNTLQFSRMETADLAFEKLHLRNIRLLRDSNSAGSMLTFNKLPYNSQFSGRNFDLSNGTHKIQIADWDATSEYYNYEAVDTIIHEIGHNWDNENRYWGNFLAISGWTQSVPNGYQNYYYGADRGWAYRREAYTNNLFATTYARTNPYDDFAESFSAYFLGNRNNANISAKLNLIHQWLG